MKISRSPSGRYWSIYVAGKHVISAITKRECELYLQRALAKC